MESAEADKWWRTLFYGSKASLRNLSALADSMLDPEFIRGWRGLMDNRAGFSRLLDPLASALADGNSGGNS